MMGLLDPICAPMETSLRLPNGEAPLSTLDRLLDADSLAKWKIPRNTERKTRKIYEGAQD